MVAAIRQTVTIQSGGTLEVRSPQLLAGDRAEVIILLEDPRQPSASSSLAALDALQASLHLTPSAAAQWAQHARLERQSFGHHA